jgi:sugar phosphate isomerase/epimerase
VDGFEFVLLPEWDSENPPLTPSDAPQECEKHSVEELVQALQIRNFPVLSVHANRDVGNYLCSEDAEKVRKGIRLVQECLDFARRVNSRVCVFHFWDTCKELFDLNSLVNLYEKFRNAYPAFELSIENVPTRYVGKTPFQIMRDFKHKTLDLKWASLYNEFDSFVKIIEQVDNVHIQGKYQDGRLVSNVGKLDYEQALKKIKEAGYSGVFTVELEERVGYNALQDYIDRLKDYMK